MSGQSAARLQKDCDCTPADASPSAPVHSAAVLQELIQQFKVCWITLPEVIPAAHEKHRIGFLMELQTKHEHGEKDFARDCARCQRARVVLRIIAHWIVGHAARFCPCRVEVQAPFVSVATTQGNQIKLALRIIHGNECHLTHDHCETCWLTEMTKCLKELGATEAGLK